MVRQTVKSGKILRKCQWMKTLYIPPCVSTVFLFRVIHFALLESAGVGALSFSSRDRNFGKFTFTHWTQKIKIESERVTKLFEFRALKRSTSFVSTE